jgi:hypothetical protein
MLCPSPGEGTGKRLRDASSELAALGIVIKKSLSFAALCIVEGGRKGGRSALNPASHRSEIKRASCFTGQNACFRPSHIMIFTMRTHRAFCMLSTPAPAGNVAVNWRRKWTPMCMKVRLERASYTGKRVRLRSVWQSTDGSNAKHLHAERPPMRRLLQLLQWDQTPRPLVEGSSQGRLLLHQPPRTLRRRPRAVYRRPPPQLDQWVRTPRTWVPRGEQVARRPD